MNFVQTVSFDSFFPRDIYLAANHREDRVKISCNAPETQSLVEEEKEYGSQFTCKLWWWWWEGGGEEERNIGIEEKLREVGYDRVRDRLY